ncbi:helix-turn-helix domain-containing protein [Psychrobium sp. nBUS_13]|uniref:helix-turn-helix domain-containing protein n=1 Tax=Psychrobium sp. nBUS_13 TaxID=3395319 RepID=UPI003EBD9D04
MYRLLHQLGFSWITSRSRHPKQSDEVQETFKKIRNGNDPHDPVECEPYTNLIKFVILFCEGKTNEGKALD